MLGVFLAGRHEETKPVTITDHDLSELIGSACRGALRLRLIHRTSMTAGGTSSGTIRGTGVTQP